MSNIIILKLLYHLLIFPNVEENDLDLANSLYKFNTVGKIIGKGWEPGNIFICYIFMMTCSLVLLFY